jgi:hypothetical protein
MPYLGVKPADEFTSKDLNGEELILDADADTTITADTDDTIDIKIAGADDFQFTANTFTALSGSTVAIASGATIANSGTATGFGVSLANDTNNYVTTATGSSGLNGEANLTFDGNALTVKGTSPSITIGDAGAEDTKIVFDGNAQDFHIGLDDTDDDFKIGLGSAVGTTAHMVFDASGAVTKPLQPCVLVELASAVTNFSINTEHTILWGTEVFDVGGDMSGSTFTAPVTGKYLINYSVRINEMDSDASTYYLTLLASNRTYYNTMNIGAWTADVAYWNVFPGSWVVDMDASDTFLMKIYQAGGTAQSDLPNAVGDSWLNITLLV